MAENIESFDFTANRERDRRSSNNVKLNTFTEAPDLGSVSIAPQANAGQVEVGLASIAQPANQSTDAAAWWGVGEVAAEGLAAVAVSADRAIKTSNNNVKDSFKQGLKAIQEEHLSPEETTVRMEKLKQESQAQLILADDGMLKSFDTEIGTHFKGDAWRDLKDSYVNKEYLRIVAEKQKEDPNWVPTIADTIKIYEDIAMEKLGGENGIKDTRTQAELIKFRGMQAEMAQAESRDNLVMLLEQNLSPEALNGTSIDTRSPDQNAFYIAVENSSMPPVEAFKLYVDSLSEEIKPVLLRDPKMRQTLSNNFFKAVKRQREQNYTESRATELDTNQANQNLALEQNNILGAVAANNKVLGSAISPQTRKTHPGTFFDALTEIYVRDPNNKAIVGAIDPKDLPSLTQAQRTDLITKSVTSLLQTPTPIERDGSGTGYEVTAFGRSLGLKTTDDVEAFVKSKTGPDSDFQKEMYKTQFLPKLQETTRKKMQDDISSNNFTLGMVKTNIEGNARNLQRLWFPANDMHPYVDEDSLYKNKTLTETLKTYSSAEQTKFNDTYPEGSEARAVMEKQWDEARLGIQKSKESLATREQVSDAYRIANIKTRKSVVEEMGALEKQVGGTILPEDMFRGDGSVKGSGWQGVFTNAKGQNVTEYTVGVEIDGKEYDIPSIVPSLSTEEIASVLKASEDGSPVSEQVMEKAVGWAKSMLKIGHSFFANKTEVDIEKEKSLEKSKEDRKILFNGLLNTSDREVVQGLLNEFTKTLPDSSPQKNKVFSIDEATSIKNSLNTIENFKAKAAEEDAKVQAKVMGVMYDSNPISQEDRLAAFGKSDSAVSMNKVNIDNKAFKITGRKEPLDPGILIQKEQFPTDYLTQARNESGSALDSNGSLLPEARKIWDNAFLQISTAVSMGNENKEGPKKFIGWVLERIRNTSVKDRSSFLRSKLNPSQDDMLLSAFEDVLNSTEREIDFSQYSPADQLTINQIRTDSVSSGYKAVTEENRLSLDNQGNTTFGSEASGINDRIERIETELNKAYALNYGKQSLEITQPTLESDGMNPYRKETIDSKGVRWENSENVEKILNGLVANQTKRKGVEIDNKVLFNNSLDLLRNLGYDDSLFRSTNPISYDMKYDGNQIQGDISTKNTALVIDIIVFGKLPKDITAAERSEKAEVTLRVLNYLSSKDTPTNVENMTLVNEYRVKQASASLTLNSYGNLIISSFTTDTRSNTTKEYEANKGDVYAPGKKTFADSYIFTDAPMGSDRDGKVLYSVGPRTRSEKQLHGIMYATFDPTSPKLNAELMSTVVLDADAYNTAITEYTEIARIATKDGYIVSNADFLLFLASKSKFTDQRAFTESFISNTHSEQTEIDKNGLLTVKVNFRDNQRTIYFDFSVVEENKNVSPKNIAAQKVIQTMNRIKKGMPINKNFNLANHSRSRGI